MRSLSMETINKTGARIGFAWCRLNYYQEAFFQMFVHFLLIFIQSVGHRSLKIFSRYRIRISKRISFEKNMSNFIFDTWKFEEQPAWEKTFKTNFCAWKISFRSFRIGLYYISVYYMISQDYINLNSLVILVAILRPVKS